MKTMARLGAMLLGASRMSIAMQWRGSLGDTKSSNVHGRPLWNINAKKLQIPSSIISLNQSFFYLLPAAWPRTHLTDYIAM